MNDIMIEAVKIGASDIHITEGLPIIVRVDGYLRKLNKEILDAKDCRKYIDTLIKGHLLEVIDERGEVDFSYSIDSEAHFRISVFKQKGKYAMAIRIIPIKIPSMEELGLPNSVKDVLNLRRGLVLVTGPTGSGKSTTLSSIIDTINKERPCHILTLEDPIEFRHKHNKAMINQREIGFDSKSFPSALKSALRQDPDIILVGEMRDLDTISTALTAAETGHLVLSTLHTSGAVKTIDRIIDVFPPHQQGQVRMQLSTVLERVISQQLLPLASGKGRKAAFETLVSNSAIRNLIREGKTHQIENVIQTGANLGMMTMDSCLLEYYRDGYLKKEDIIGHAYNPLQLKKLLV